MNTSRLAGIVAAVVLGLYLLSPAPVVKYYVTTNKTPQEVVEWIYAPLGWVCDHVRPVSYVYERYFKMWGMPTP